MGTCSPQVQASCLLGSWSQRWKKTMAQLNARRRSVLQQSVQNKWQKRHASARRSKNKNTAQEPRPQLPRPNASGKGGRSKIARHVSAKSVRDGSVKRKKPTRLAERDEQQRLQQRPLVRPSPHLRDANLWRDVRTVVPALI
jgi:hypothetical protein